MRELLVEDLRHLVPASPSRLPWGLEALIKVFLHPRIKAVAFYRVGQILAARRLLVVAYLLQSRAIRASGAEISPLAELGPGLCLVHSSGIVIGPQVRAGRNLRLYHGVTLGDGASAGQPQLGDDVMIGAGASILGGVRIGDRVVIGANSVVTCDIPDDCVAVGAPARWQPRSERHAHYLRAAAV